MPRGFLFSLILACAFLLAVNAGADVACDGYNDYLHWLPHDELAALSAGSIIIDGNFAYVTDDGLSVFDLCDPDAPQLIAELAGTETAVDKAGDILVCADSYDLQLVDVSDPEAPFLRGRIETISRCVAADGDLAIATNWRYGRDYLQVYDIANPDAPALVAEINVTNVTSVSAEIEGDLAFVAYSNTQGEAFLQPVDLTNPASPVLLTPFVETGTYYYDIELIGDRLYSIAHFGLLKVMDISDPSAPVILGSTTFEICYPRLTVAGDRAYVTSDQLHRMTIVDLSDESAPRVQGSLDSRFEAKGVAAAFGRAYVVGQPYGFDGYQPAWLRVADVTNAELPEPIGQLALDAWRDLVVADGLAYVIGNAGLVIVDLADPVAPAEISTTDLGGSIRAFIVSKQIGYFLVRVATSDLHLRVMDLSDPASPSMLSDRSLPCNYLHDLVKTGNHLCVAQRTWTYMDYATFLTMVDVSDPAAPVITSNVGVQEYDFGNDIHLCAAGDGVHLFYGRNYFPAEIAVMDISDPADPYTVTAFNIEEDFQFLQRSGDRLMVSGAKSAGAMDEGVLTLLDCSDPTQMQVLSTLTLARAANEIVMEGDFSADGFYLASYLEGVLACTAADPGAPEHLGTWTLSVSKLADGGGFLVGIQDFFGLLTIPYHCDPTAVELAPCPARPLAAQPNPFNPATMLHFDLARDGRVELTIHDLAGRRVRTLISGSLPAGPHRARWDGRDGAGRAIASGLYFARLETAAGLAAAKLMLLK